MVGRADIRIGLKFGQLTVLGEAPSRRIPSGALKRYYAVRCDCGREIEISREHLPRNGACRKCGHLKAAAKHVKHGDSAKKTRIYNIWCEMRKRCRPGGHDRYAGRGISVCQEWHDYATFKVWALKNGYEDHLTLDRVDNDQGYGPNNCEWVTLSENSKRMHKARNRMPLWNYTPIEALWGAA